MVSFIKKINQELLDETGMSWMDLIWKRIKINGPSFLLTLIFSVIVISICLS